MTGLMIAGTMLGTCGLLVGVYAMRWGLDRIDGMFRLWETWSEQNPWR